MRLSVLVENTACCSGVVPEHGLSLLIETGNHRILFDTGCGAAFAENAERMGIDLSTVNLAILSHGHYDHGGGLARFLDVNRQACVWVSPHAFDAHFNAAGKNIGLPPVLAENPRVRQTPASAYELAPGVVLHAAPGGEYPAPEPGMRMQVGELLVPDDFQHEQCLLVEESGRRFLISGCSHKGILNLVSHFSPDVLVGGFHLMKKQTAADAAYLQQVANVLQRFPTRYYTGHCTGETAYQFLKPYLQNRLERLSSGMVLDL